MHTDARHIVLFGEHTEVCKYYFTVPADVSLAEFKQNPWDFHDGDYKVISVESGELEIRDADEQFGGEA